MNIVVTGTYKGIGKKLAEYYLNQGHIVCGCSRHEGTITHPNYFHYITDVTYEEMFNKFSR